MKTRLNTIIKKMKKVNLVFILIVTLLATGRNYAKYTYFLNKHFLLVIVLKTMKDN